MPVVWRVHVEVVCDTPPALNRITQSVLQVFANVEEAGCTWTSVEVLVRAPHCQVDAEFVEVDRH